MARSSFTIERQLNWGTLRYDTVRHRFSYTEDQRRNSEPYGDIPVVLNVVVTRRCNMSCEYCVARDFDGIESQDLVISDEMLSWINSSPFMLLVLTGGEPLMPPYDNVSLHFIECVRDRGLVLDTNGIVLPNREVLGRLKKKRVMVRISLDSVRPKEETGIRHLKRGFALDDKSAYFTKLQNIQSFVDAGVTTAVQTVVWRTNTSALFQMIDWLSEHGIRRWYLQRLIPSHKFKYPSPRIALTDEKYYSIAPQIVDRARSAGIECIAKMDLRHNSVFLLTSQGTLYSQGSAPGQKIRLGTIHDDIDYFGYVSAADHACRYYLAEQHAMRKRESRAR